MRLNLATTVLGAILTAATFAACGEGGGAARNQVDSGEYTTSSLLEPAAEPRREPPTTVPPDLFETNPNRQDQDLGSLCWARWEILRILFDGYRGASDEALARFSEGIGEISQHAAAAEERLPERYREFRDHFVRALGTARDRPGQSSGESADEQFMRVQEPFDFDNYPGISEYLATAPEDPDCEMP
jgi:hypothetical protein